MRLPGLLIAILMALAVNGILVTHGNTYKARLPEKPFFAAADLEGNVGGFASGAPAGAYSITIWTIYFYNLPKEGGPFTYHIHAKPVVNGDCTTAGGKHDARHIGEKVKCDAGNHYSCQVGDLSGKHGVIDKDPYSVKYRDYDTSIFMSEIRFFGDKSLVISYANGTRLTCANFVRQSTVLKPNGTKTDTVDFPTIGPYNGSPSTAQISLLLTGGALVAWMMLFAL